MFRRFCGSTEKLKSGCPQFLKNCGAPSELTASNAKRGSGSSETGDSVEVVILRVPGREPRARKNPGITNAKKSGTPLTESPADASV